MASQTRNPTGDGTFSGTWTGSVGSRFGLVDDHPDTTGADKLTHGTTAGRATFTFSAFTVPAGSVITNVQVLYYDEKTGGSAASWGAFLRIGGADQSTNDAHNPANGTWTLRTATYTQNPKTSAAWLVNDVNGSGTNPLQGFGIVASDANPTCELASIQLVVNYSPPSDGTLSKTLDDMSRSLTGTVDVTGATTATLEGLGISAAGTVEDAGVSGALAATLDDATAAGAGTVDVQGQATPTLGAMTSAGTGTVDVSGAASITLEGLGAALTGTVAVTAALSAQLEGLALSSAGTVAVAGALAATLADLTASGTGTVAVAGAVGAQLEGIGLEAAGVVGNPPVVGELAATLEALTASGTGEVAVSGALAVMLEGLSATITGGPAVTGTTAGQLEDAQLEAAGTVRTAGTFSPGKQGTAYPPPDHHSRASGINPGWRPKREDY